MTLFTQFLSQNSALDELKFTWNSNDNAQALLSGVDFSTYKVLDFSGNNLQTNGRTDISDLITANPPLEELNLDRNRLNDDDAVLIAQSLGGNILHLTKLYMNYNNIQERGMRVSNASQLHRKALGRVVALTRVVITIRTPRLSHLRGSVTRASLAATLARLRRIPPPQPPSPSHDG
ncbi:hypothetical protein THAOC_13785 [Thalassiosira oceanica]|uniref:Uncharacterized protein n=1 Tax=Thalassiosira oceanica TaxID=159749 RepID=K0SJ37_THAOC|nr:hypothetical protein THAOC_13785 [Thalassiosira oceanica]|eukprot:EJK65360.1 hypothetical protein THAOC_13785 [Thalassiosira oceanica]